MMWPFTKRQTYKLVRFDKARIMFPDGVLDRRVVEADGSVYISPESVTGVRDAVDSMLEYPHTQVFITGACEYVLGTSADVVHALWPDIFPAPQPAATPFREVEVAVDIQVEPIGLPMHLPPIPVGDEQEADGLPKIVVVVCGGKVETILGTGEAEGAQYGVVDLDNLKVGGKAFEGWAYVDFWEEMDDEVREALGPEEDEDEECGDEQLNAEDAERASDVADAHARVQTYLEMCESGAFGEELAAELAAGHLAGAPCAADYARIHADCLAGQAKDEDAEASAAQVRERLEAAPDGP